MRFITMILSLLVMLPLNSIADSGKKKTRPPVFIWPHIPVDGAKCDSHSECGIGWCQEITNNMTGCLEAIFVLRGTCNAHRCTYSVTADNDMAARCIGDVLSVPGCIPYYDGDSLNWLSRNYTACGDGAVCEPVDATCQESAYACVMHT